jgi:hypothetical protein
MEKLIASIIAVAGLSVSAQAQALTNLTNAKATAALLSLSTQAQDSIQRYQRLNKWAVVNLPGWHSVVTNVTTTVTDDVTNTVTTITTNNPSRTLAETAEHVMANEKVSRVVKEIADRQRDAIKAMKAGADTASIESVD